MDQFFEVLPMEPIQGHLKRVNVADAESIHTHATLVSSNGAAVATSLPSLTTRDGKLSHFAARMEIDSLVAAEYASYRDAVRAQLDLKVAAVLALYQRQLVRGDSVNAGEFNGLVTQATPTMISADGDKPTAASCRRARSSRRLPRSPRAAGFKGDTW